MNKLERVGGVFAILEALIYVLAFVFYGAVFNFPETADANQQFTFLADNQIILSVVNFIMYGLLGWAFICYVVKKLAKSPMSDSLSTGDGDPTEAQIRLHERWADDGAAAVCWYVN